MPEFDKQQPSDAVRDVFEPGWREREAAREAFFGDFFDRLSVHERAKIRYVTTPDGDYPSPDEP